jgi:uncharacterized membrane protein
MDDKHGATHVDGQAPRRVRLIVTAVMVPMIMATAVALAVLWPRTSPPHDTSGQSDRHMGTVTDVHQRTCAPDEVIQTPTGLTTSRCGNVTVRVDDGPDKGRAVVTAIPDGPGAPTVGVGDEVVLLKVSDSEDPSRTEYTITDHQRGSPLLWLVLLSAAVIVVFARWRGVAALAGLAVSFAVLLLFILPAISVGRPPLPVAVVGSATIMFAVLYLTHGISVRTSVAVLGTLASLVLTGLLGLAATAATHLTGFGDEAANTLAVYFQNVDLHGLLLAGIIIGSLGVLDDVTVTQAATVAELAEANPTLPRLRLYQAATRVGRAHIAAVVNTIVLAYAGASLPLLLLILTAGRGVSETLTSEFVAQEIVRSAVATIGLVAAVPVTTALATLITGTRGAIPTPRRPPEPQAPHGNADQRRPARHAADRLGPIHGHHAHDDPWQEPADTWPDPTSSR